jgi:hypothetical protein
MKIEQNRENAQRNSPLECLCFTGRHWVCVAGERVSHRFLVNLSIFLGDSVTVNNNNLSDFLKGTVGGSYLCNSELTTNLGGVELRTTDLQYKAFNNNNNTKFDYGSKHSLHFSSSAFPS